MIKSSVVALDLASNCLKAEYLEHNEGVNRVDDPALVEVDDDDDDVG